MWPHVCPAEPALDILLHLIYFSSLISFCLLCQPVCLTLLVWSPTPNESWKDAAAGPPGTRNHALLGSPQLRHITYSMNQLEWHHAVQPVRLYIHKITNVSAISRMVKAKVNLQCLRSNKNVEHLLTLYWNLHKQSTCSEGCNEDLGTGTSNNDHLQY